MNQLFIKCMHFFTALKICRFAHSQTMYLIPWHFVSIPVCDELHPCEGLGRYATFKNFGMAFLLLFRVSTGDNWNGIMKVGHSEIHGAFQWCTRSYLKCFVRVLTMVFSNLFTPHFYTLCVHVAGHAQRLLPRHWHLLQHDGIPHLLCVLCTDGPVCAGQCGDCCAHEAPGGKQQRG